MIFKSIVIISLISTLNIFAAEPPTSKEEYCKLSFDKDDFINIASSSLNRMAFLNYGGLINGGVCWWHSMFTRNVTYFGIFQPNKSKPNSKEIKDIINHIIVGDAVTYIPGYSNLNEFSQENELEIQRALENWQLTDGGVGLGWIRGITGHSKGDPKDLEKTMDELYENVKNKHQIQYQMLGMSGIDAHAWLVIDVIKTSTGYKFRVIDSNFVSVRMQEYKRGDASVKTEYGDVMLYNSRDILRKATIVRSRFCDLDISNIDLDSQKNN